MSIHYDEKGKIFSHVIRKSPILATIQTLTHRIHGTIHVRNGDRLIDELANSGQFLAVTGATIFASSGKPLYRSDFLSVNRDLIIWLLPAEEGPSETSASGG